MVIETTKENLNINKVITTKRDTMVVEGEMIIPDSKPDIINTIDTSGIIAIYKKELTSEKLKLEGDINTYIMYLSDDEGGNIRGVSTKLNFSEIIQISNVDESMKCRLVTNLKNIETKIINERKISIKATIDLDIKIYLNEKINFVKEIPENQNIQTLTENLNLNSLVGIGENRIFAKDTILGDNNDSLAEILKASVFIGNKDVKVSYNKILTKAEANVKILYLTEENKIKSTEAKIPVVGFIDIQNVSENNIINVDYEIKNIVLNPSENEENSVDVDLEILATAIVYESKEISLIQDLYSPIEKLEINQKNIVTLSEKRIYQEKNQINENIKISGIDDGSIIDTYIVPVINEENKTINKISYIGELEIYFLILNDSLQLESRKESLNFEQNFEISDAQSLDTETSVEILSQNIIIQENGNINCNIEIQLNVDVSKRVSINAIDSIQTSGKRDDDDYSVLMYIVKPGDSLWNIAKEFGSTIEEIVRLNNIEDENIINDGDKIYIPHYSQNVISLAK